MGCCASEPIDFDKEVDITHFEIGISIGKGAFGRVRIVQHKKSKTQYALKYMNKAEIIKRGSAEHVLSERRLLEEAQHTFIVNMRYAFQDDEHLLMVLDLKLGGDLRFHLTYKGPFTEHRARYYFTEVACALHYLHELKIVHRDIKPDNILLDDQGHASVTDFNVACHYMDDRMMTSKSGTARYMAPEVISGQGYLNAIDWWSLAITTYEMMYGYPPFRARHKDELKKAILSDSIEWAKNPKVTISETATNCITAMLAKPLEERLGSNETGGFKKIQEHEWFRGIDWKKVEAREYPVPFKPDVEKNAYHDPRFGLEEMFSGRNELADKPVRNGGSIAGRRRSSAVVQGQSQRTSTSEKLVPVPGNDGARKDSQTATAFAQPDKKRSSFFNGPKREDLPEITSAEELQLQLFENKYLVYDFSKPTPMNKTTLDINTMDLPPPPSAQDESTMGQEASKQLSIPQLPHLPEEES
ncbi:kinase-like domain-containing protein [Chytriomyces sp. MP71]|nr:kinase-like domain-containing protein [Chytriomyces sp. MP71]KAI8611661.1 kinase-like domain-containing protein [Chytriomyces sp. MP71]